MVLFLLLWSLARDYDDDDDDDDVLCFTNLNDLDVDDDGHKLLLFIALYNH